MDEADAKEGAAIQALGDVRASIPIAENLVGAGTRVDRLDVVTCGVELWTKDIACALSIVQVDEHSEQEITS